MRMCTWVVALVCVIAAMVASPVPAARGQARGDEPAKKAETSAPKMLQSVGVPAARAAKNVAIISIHGEIDEWTERSVRRRIKLAEQAGADAMVFDLDTPGGAGHAMLLISSAIKASSVKNTVAWVNAQAYSAGAVIALACREIVVNDGAAMGDALPIAFDQIFGVMGLGDAEREKFLGPIMADLIESARRNGQDEILVQGFVRRGVELWLVEHKETGERLFVTAEQYQQAVGEEAPRGVPTVPSITGEVDNSASGPAAPAKPRGGKKKDGASAAGGGRAEGDKDGTEYQPASPSVSEALRNEVDQSLSISGTVSTRPNLNAPGHKGKYTLVEYVSSGNGVLTFHTDALLRYKIAKEKVRDETELKAYFGATNFTRLDETWSERLSRFLSQFWVRGVLIVIFIIALFIEMVHPGLILPGSIAAVALIALVVPPILVNMAAWWMVAAILGGILMVMLELFVLPGIGVFGIIGALLLFGGLVGAAVGGPQNLFPGAGGRPSGELVWGLTTALISLVTAGVAIFFIAKFLPSLPFLDRIILKDDPEAMAGTLAMESGGWGAEGVRIGDEGVAITPLRPSGRVQVGERIVDVVADMGMIEPGRRVRVVSADAFRIVVEAV